MTQGTKMTIRVDNSDFYRGKAVNRKVEQGKATLQREQGGYQNYVVRLDEPFAGYKAGHLIAIPEKDIIEIL